MDRLLLVDDEKDVLFFLKTFFQAKNFEVHVAESGKEAIKKVKEVRPHIVLLDIVMPDMSGLETLTAIKEIDPAIGVIMATAVRDNEIGKQAMKLGAYDYVTKPFDLEYMETTVLIKLIQMIG